jgi:molybdenum cofactor cytidylyltransferase
MDLMDALDARPGDVVAFVGGGGKTTAMYRLCAEAAARGLHAVASGTARFTEPAGGRTAPLVVEEDRERLVAEVKSRLDGAGWVIAASGKGSKERLLPISFDAVASFVPEGGVDLVVVEADGSALRPFKAPADHEPVVPPSATLAVAVAGADVFGRALSAEAVHRPERVAELTGERIGARVTPEMVATVLAHREGGRKGVPERARFAVLINKVDDQRLEAARAAAERLREQGVPRVLLGNVREPAPVVEVFTS